MIATSLKRVLLALAVASLLLASWGLIEPRLILDEVHEEARIPGLPDALRGRRIAVLADWQTGMWMANEAMIERAMGRVVEGRPAALLLAGDFLYRPADEASREEVDEELEPEDWQEIRAQIERAVQLVRPARAAGIPVFAVLGNHDYLKEEVQSAGVPVVADRLAEALRQAGVTVLRNQASPLAAPGAPLYIGGVDSPTAGRADVGATLAAIPGGAPRILLMHEPGIFAQLPAGSAPLALAGHTHGGQIRLPGFPHWSWMAIMQPGRVTTDGWIKDYGATGNRLYVNRGIGFSTVPLRIFCPPELTWVTLRD